MNMTFTKSCHLFFLCFIVPLLVFSDVELPQGTKTLPLLFFLCSNPFPDPEIAYIMLAGPKTHILHAFHEGRNGSITVSVKAEEHAHSTSSKIWLHGTFVYPSITCLD